MTDLLIRDVEPETKAELEERARRNGRSLSAEARACLRTGLTLGEEREGLGARIARRFEQVGFSEAEHAEFESALREPEKSVAATAAGLFRVILLDTNVVSELMKSGPRPEVREWLDRQTDEEIWTSTLTLYEVRWGIERLPPSRRRTLSDEGFEAFLRHDLRNRVAKLDEAAAFQAAALQARRVRGGTVQQLADTLIAGIALSRRATIATRNIRHFDDLSVTVVDPWMA